MTDPATEDMFLGAVSKKAVQICFFGSIYGLEVCIRDTYNTYFYERTKEEMYIFATPKKKQTTMNTK